VIYFLVAPLQNSFKSFLYQPAPSSFPCFVEFYAVFVEFYAVFVELYAVFVEPA
jgi:hypothetical protein